MVCGGKQSELRQGDLLGKSAAKCYWNPHSKCVLTIYGVALISVWGACGSKCVLIDWSQTNIFHQSLTAISQYTCVSRHNNRELVVEAASGRSVPQARHAWTILGNDWFERDWRETSPGSEILLRSNPALFRGRTELMTLKLEFYGDWKPLRPPNLCLIPAQPSMPATQARTILSIKMPGQPEICASSVSDLHWPKATSHKEGSTWFIPPITGLFAKTAIGKGRQIKLSLG